MIVKNYILIALRGLNKNKGYTLITIAGLAVALACTLLIGLYVWDEWRVDRHHPHGERTYRLIAEEHTEGRITFEPGVAGGLRAALEHDFPEIEHAARVINPSYITTWVNHEGATFPLQFCTADAALLNIFDLPLLKGDPATVLDAPNAIVITASTAQRLFGDTDPLGQTITAEGFWGGDYVVTGILRDHPAQSTLQFDILSGHVGTLFDSWEVSDWRPIHTYVLLKEGTQPDKLESQLPSWITRYTETQGQLQTTYHLQPLTRLYLHSASDYGLTGYGDWQTLRLLLLIGAIILLIAAINTMNLSTARATQRATEVGIRKVVGASRRQLISQFLGERILVTAVALFLALGLAALALPSLNSFTAKALTLSVGNIWVVLAGFALFAGLVGVLSGLYPAFVLSAFRPASVLKGSTLGSPRGARLRKALVVVQFTITTVLLICTGVIYQQSTFLAEQSWGFNQDEVVVLPIIAEDPAPMWSENWLGFQQSALKQAFLQHPHVLAATISHVTPPSSITTQVHIEGEPEPRQMQYIYTDKDFLDTYEIDLVAGRNFDRELLSAQELPDILLNETAVKQLGWANPVGRQLLWEGTNTMMTVKGVIRDFLSQDMSQPILPLFLMQMAQPPQLLSLRLQVDDLPETLAFLEATWAQFLPTRPFQFEFAQAHVQRMYTDEKRLGQMMGTLGLLAAFIACLGLFGLAAFTAEQRTKEIGIRKVMGATVAQVFGLLSGSFITLVVVANILAWPVAYIAMQRWLATFAFRIELSWSLFLGAGLVAEVVAVVTVGYQAVKAALANPAETLRSL